MFIAIASAVVKLPSASASAAESSCCAEARLCAWTGAALVAPISAAAARQPYNGRMRFPLVTRSPQGNAGTTVSGTTGAHKLHRQEAESLQIQGRTCACEEGETTGGAGRRRSGVLVLRSSSIPTW